MTQRPREYVHIGSSLHPSASLQKRNSIHVSQPLQYRNSIIKPEIRDAKSLQDVSAHHATEIVHLNVGGKRYATLYETLARSKSVFFNQFIRIDETSGKVLLYHRYFTDDGQNAIFVNRDGELFAHVLHFLRDGKKAPLPSDQFLLKQLTRESEFYGLENWRRCLHEQLRYENTIKGDLEDAIVGIRADVSEIAKNSYQNERTYQR